MIDHSFFVPSLLVIGAIGIGITNFKRSPYQPMTRKQIQALALLAIGATLLVFVGMVYGK